MSRFSCLKVAPPFYIDNLLQSYVVDNASDKINLFASTCKADDGSTWILKEIKGIELNMACDPKMNHEYIHPLGIQQFRDAAVRFLLGDSSEVIKQGKAVGVQTLGNSVGLRLGLEFLFKQMGHKTFYIASPTSDDQEHVFSRHKPPIQILKYPYWNFITNSLDLEGMMDCLSRAEEESVIVLQMCGHNPTGCDLSKHQWIQVANIMQERRLFPFFDASYQGLSSGDPDEDAWPVRYFADRGFELLCSQSFSTNLGLYDCCVGNLTFITTDVSNISSILSESTWNFYNIYGTPFQHGARIVLTILQDPNLRSKWLSNLKELSAKLQETRRKFLNTLRHFKSVNGNNWTHLEKQTGLFAITGLSEEQVHYLRDRYRIYIRKDGTINISVLNEDSVEYVATCIHKTVVKYPSAALNNNDAAIANAYLD